MTLHRNCQALAALLRKKPVDKLRLLARRHGVTFEPSRPLERRSTSSEIETCRISSVQPNPILKRHSHSSHASKVVPFILPDIGEGIVEVLIKDWFVKVGDHVKEFDSICDVESDKATATITSRFDGVITKIHYEPGSLAKVGHPLVDIEAVAGTSSGQESDGSSTRSDRDSRLTLTEDARPASRPDEGRPITAALPSVRRLAEQHGVDLSQIKPTGKGGRIVLKEDLLAFMAHQQSAAASTTSLSRDIDVRGSSQLASSSTGVKPVPRAPSDRETTQALTGIRKAMFKTMTQSLKVPLFNYSDEIDMTRLVEVTRESRERGEEKVSHLAYIVKVVSLALLEHPELNATVDDAGERLTIKHYHNIGVAIDTKAGLVVPNVKNVQDLSIHEVSNELVRLRELGSQTKLGPEDLQGATLTLSNIGSVGGIFGIPRLVPPEIVIGALGRTRLLPRFNCSGQVEGRHLLQLVWAADHRAVDGATLSRFTNLIKQYLERPERALLALR